MAKKSPAFQLYIDDLLGSGTVQSASTEEIGAYVLLLCYDWQEVGFVYDERRLASVTKLSVPRFRKAWSHLGAKFPERDGRCFNPRLEKERVKQAAWEAKASEKGRKGADARWHGQCPDDATGIEEMMPKDMPGPMPGDGFPVSRFPVTAKALHDDTQPTEAERIVRDSLPRPEYVAAFANLLRGAEKPGDLAASVRGYGPGGIHEFATWEEVGHGLMDCAAAPGATTPAKIKAFIRRIQVGDPPPRQYGAPRQTQREKNLAVARQVIAEEEAA